MRRVLHIMVLILAGEMIFSLPFHTARFFRPTLLEVFGFTNTQLGDVFARLDYEDEPGQVAILTRAIGRGLRAGDDAAVRRAAEALIAIDPTALPALLALRRLAQIGGQRAGQIDRRLTGVLRAPAPAAALHHATALEAEAHGGLGYTWDCDVQFWFKRALFDWSMLGDPGLHRRRTADLLRW